MQCVPEGESGHVVVEEGASAPVRHGNNTVDDQPVVCEMVGVKGNDDLVPDVDWNRETHPLVANPGLLRELKARPQWVGLRLMDDHDNPGKKKKIPSRLDDPDRGASCTDRSHWGAFNEVMRLLDNGTYSGLMYALTVEDNVVFIDLDHVRDAKTGVIEPWACEVIDTLNSYTEFSVSGTGVHIYVAGTLQTSGNRSEQVEIYASKRFMVVTGNHMVGTPEKIMPRQNELEKVFNQHIGERTESAVVVLEDAPRESGPLVHSTIASLQSLNEGTLRSLWQGEWKSLGYPSQSEADLAFVGLLRKEYRLNKDEAFLVMKQSGLMRPKWERTDYREKTWATAVKQVAEAIVAPACTDQRRRETPIEAAVHGKPYPMTDLGNAERYVHYNKEGYRWDPSIKEWRVWDDKRWAVDKSMSATYTAGLTARSIRREVKAMQEELKNVQFTQAGAAYKEIMERLQDWASGSESRERLKAMLELAKAQPGMTLDPDSLDANLWLFNAMNGTINLRTGVLGPHQKEDLITKLSPVEYIPGTKDERWDRFLSEATGGDPTVLNFLQKAMGYTLTGDVSEEKLFFLFGPKNGGKSTFVEATRSVMGDYARTIQTDLLAKNKTPNAGGASPELAMLSGVRMAAGSEMERGREMAEALAKNLTGGDKITARHLYASYFDFMPQFKLWLALNHCPMVSSDDDAIWRRIVRIGFDRTVPPDQLDRTLKPYLRSADGGGKAVLAWAVEGCQRWQKEGLNVPDRVVNSTQMYRDESDPLATFFQDCLLFDNPEAWTPFSTIQQHYQKHAEENGVQERYRVSPKRLQEKLKSRGATSDRRHCGRGWKGVGENPDWISVSASPWE